MTNADLTPSQFSANDITQEEGTNVNIQVTPAGASWTTSVSITPSGSGLVYDNYSVIQGTLADVGADTTYTVTVTRANSYGSSVGTMTITATDVAPVQTNLTAWTKALDFNGSSEYAVTPSQSNLTNPLRMDFLAYEVAAPNTVGNTSSSGFSRPWATAIVFQSKNITSNQHIWNSGEGAGGNDDNIYLKVSGTNGDLYFGWGREGDANQCLIGNIGGISNSTHWWGIYVGFNGTRLSGTNATPSRLAAAFDIRLMGSNDAPSAWSGLYDVGTEARWNSSSSSTGARMDRAVRGDFTIGGRGSNRNFHGKVASMVVTTLRIGQPMPTDAEIRMMITDPKKWEDDYRVGQTVRKSTGTQDVSYSASNFYNGYGNTQIWLMGDGVSDSYANGIRNEVYPSEQNYTKLQLNSMVSNDIETVNISGLT